MGVKVKGGMYCGSCRTPVAAQKGTNRLRNTGAVLGAPLTGGWSLFGAKGNDWHCPHCGGEVASLRAVRMIARARGIDLPGV